MRREIDNHKIDCAVQYIAPVNQNNRISIASEIVFPDPELNNGDKAAGRVKYEAVW